MQYNQVVLRPHDFYVAKVAPKRNAKGQYTGEVGLVALYTQKGKPVKAERNEDGWLVGPVRTRVTTRPRLVNGVQVPAGTAYTVQAVYGVKNDRVYVGHVQAVA